MLEFGFGKAVFACFELFLPITGIKTPIKKIMHHK
jgi:hypothetical protein